MEFVSDINVEVDFWDEITLFSTGRCELFNPPLFLLLVKVGSGAGPLVISLMSSLYQKKDDIKKNDERRSIAISTFLPLPLSF